MKRQQMSTRTMVVAAMMTALVVILQYMGAIVKFGPFSVSLVLIPIVIGTITCGEFVGAWLGFVFGLVVLLTGDAAPFMAVNIPGTIITVLIKGIACGYVSGACYKLINKILSSLFVSFFPTCSCWCYHPVHRVLCIDITYAIEESVALNDNRVYIYRHTLNDTT